MAKKTSRRTYQQSGPAAPATARKVLRTQPTIANPSGIVGRKGNAPLPRQHPIHNTYN